MKSVVFVAPFFRDNTNRYIKALAQLDEVRLGIVSQDPIDCLDPVLRDRVQAFARVTNCLDGRALAAACVDLGRSFCPIDRLLGTLEQLQIPLAEAREAVRIPGMWTSTARNFRDKSQMKQVLRNAGIPVARHRLLTHERDAWAFVGEVGFPIIVKPVAGLGAASTWRVGDHAELRAVLSASPPSEQHPLQAEEFVSGQENTCETVTIDGQAVWRSGTHYLPGPLEVLENPWMQYCVLLPREADDPEFVKFHPINGAALRALGMDTGLSHMEWFRRKDGAAVVSEVGARPPGAMIMPLMSYAHEIDMVQRWAELMVHDRFAPATRKFAAGVAFFRGQGTGQVRAVRGLERAQEEVGHLVIDRRLPMLGQPKAKGYEGEGFAIVRHEDTKQVVHALRRLVTLVQVELG